MPGNMTLDSQKAAVKSGEIDTVLVCGIDMQGRLIGKRLLRAGQQGFGLAHVEDGRHALVEARARQAQKRGSGAEHLDIDELSLPISDAASGDLLALDEALLKLGEVNPRLAQVVELRFFAGLEFQEIAELLGCSVRTTKREWERARAFLYAQLA